MIKDYVSFDLETTGLDADDDSIIEIGALKIIDGKVVDRFIEFVKPEQRISPKITEITGITNAMVANARSTKDIIRDFISFCEGYVLLGHNIMFDFKFMKQHATRFGYAFEKQGLDTLQIARKTLPQLESKSLGALCEHYNITNQAAHRAYHDALATAKIYHMLAHDFETKDAKLFVPSQLQYKPKKVQPCTRKQIEYLTILCGHHNIKMKEHPETLSRSEVSKLIDNIISNYGHIF